MVEVPENFTMSHSQIAAAQGMQHNPLKSFMRQPVIYVKLPTGGKFWAHNAIHMPINGELPVLAMSTRDEIGLNTPDALMNGQAVVDMVHSCMPNITNAWAIPAVDLDIVLIAIRIASYGEKMEYRSTCPKCKNADSYEIDLRQFLDMPVNMDGYLTPFDYKGMQIFLQPSDYSTINMQNLEQFEQQRMLSVINDVNLSEAEKQAKFHKIFRLMTEYTVKTVSNTINRIITPDGQTVIDPLFIQEFVENSERQLFESVKKHIAEINKGIPEKKVATTCDSCAHDYETPFTFDQSNFFVFAS